MTLEKALLELLPLVPLCGAAMCPLGVYVVSLFSRRFGEPADPRVAGAWAAAILSGATLGLAVAALLWEMNVGAFFLYLRAPTGGQWGLVVDSLSSLALAIVALLSFVAALATFARVPEEATSHSLLLLLLGCLVSLIMARDVIQIALALQVSVLVSAALFLSSRDKQEARLVVLKYLVVAEVGAAIFLFVCVRLASLSDTTEIGDLKEAIAFGNLPTLRSLSHWLFLGWLVAVAAPTLPVLVPEILSRRPLAASVMVCGATYVGLSYTFLRVAYRGFPYLCWSALSGRMSWIGAALALGGTAAAVATRLPSRQVSYAMLGQVGLTIMALAADPPDGPTGAIIVGTGLVGLCAITRAGMLIAGTAGRSTTSRAPTRAQREVFRWSLAIVALALFGACGLTVIPLKGGRLAGPLLVLPLTAALGWRWFSYTWIERQRREKLYLVLLAVCAVTVAAMLAMPPPLRSALRQAVDELGLGEVYHTLPGR